MPESDSDSYSLLSSVEGAGLGMCDMFPVFLSYLLCCQLPLGEVSHGGVGDQVGTKRVFNVF